MNSCCKNPCDQNICKNLNYPKAIKTYINSNVQYITESDWYNSITINSWGIISVAEKRSCKTVYWVANNGANKLAKYFHNGELLEEVNTSKPPTALVYNYTDLYNDYKLITVTQAGTIEGLIIDSNNYPAGNTEVIINNNIKGAVYTGVDLTEEKLYVSNFASGYVEIYDYDFNFIKVFTDGALVKSGYHPYNVSVNGEYVYVTFARKIPESEEALTGIGFGYIDKFSRDGELLYRFISRDPLNAPWGLEFSKCDRYLYVANHGDGKINTFDLCSGEFIGPIMDENCNPVQIGGLWGISLYSDQLSFASGMDNGNNGLIGYLQLS